MDEEVDPDASVTSRYNVGNGKSGFSDEIKMTSSDGESGMTATDIRLRSVYSLEERYELQREIGQGAYGVVWLAKDKWTERQVAVKRVANVLADDKEAKRTLREIRLMRHFAGQKHILHMVDLLANSPDIEQFRDLYIVTEFMDGGDLTNWCERNGENWVPVDIMRVKRAIFAILKGLRTIHKAKVLHRDLRPKNILLGQNSVKIADFGMGRPAAKNGVRLSLMQFVSSRFYTAPEGLIPNNTYTDAVDIWAVGCIFAEMLLGRVLFRDSRVPDQMRVVVNTLGNLSEEDIASIATGTNEKYRVYLRSLIPKQPTSFRDKFPSIEDPNALDLLEQMLRYNPALRISAEQALHHPWFCDIRNSDDTLGDASQIPEFDGDDIENANTSDEMRDLIWKELWPHRQRTSGEDSATGRVSSKSARSNSKRHHR